MFPHEHIKDTISRITKHLIPLLLLITIICFLNCSLIESKDLLSNKPSSTNSPEIQWHTLLGKGLFAQGNSVEQTNDGGYIIYGTSNHQAFLIKTDEKGNKLWEKYFTDGKFIFGESVAQTSDGGYILCGGKVKKNDNWEQWLWLVKTDEYGNTIWDKEFEGERSARGYSAHEIPDEGYILSGQIDNQLVLIKTDMEGNTIFDKTFDNYYLSDGRAIQHTGDGGYIICGNYSELIGNMIQRTKMLIIKTDTDGNEVWHQIFGGDNYGSGMSVIQTEDESYVICGPGNPDDKEYEGIWLIKTDKNGNELWNSLSNYGVGTCVDTTNDGGYIACGYTIDWSIKAWLIKVDSQGNKLWDLKYEGENVTSIYSVKQTSDGGYIACGRVNSPERDLHNILLLKIAPDK
jgi:hypothetical protein